MARCEGCGAQLTLADEPIVWIGFERTGLRINLHQFCARQVEQAIHWRLAQNEAGNVPDPEQLMTFLAVVPSEKDLTG